MLNPDARSLYTAAVTPPPGYVFDQALATTYSLDPAALLSLPTNLALADRTSITNADPIRLLESLRRLSDRFSVYVDHTGMRPPSGDNVLFGLLESMVMPVKAPRGGAFHPKIWVLRFVQPEINEPPLIRVLVLSRNITYDRSWDISLQLEGRPGGRYIAANRRLGEFLQALPSMCTRPVSRSRKRQAKRLAEEVRKVSWELPDGFESVAFHVLGIDGKSWTPPWSKRMAVISPFLTADALTWLSKLTDEFSAVISRPDELKQLTPVVLKEVDQWYTLDEAAETEDGEEAEQRDTIGLHAKVYVLEKGWRTHLYLGSANATAAALLQRSNTEILVELIGRTSRIGGVGSLLEEGGLGPLLSKYVQTDEAAQPDDDEIRARKALETARDRLAEARLKVVCQACEDAWELALMSPEKLPMDGISQVRAWPITVSEDRAADSSGLARGEPAGLGRYATESVTGLIAFDLVAEAKKISLRMVLNLPVDGLPEKRDEAIFRLVLNNREGFLRYILLLLGEYAGDVLETRSLFNDGRGTSSWTEAFVGEIPILEELTRAFSRNPKKLKDVEAVIRRLMRDETTASIVPPQFIALWNIFEDAMAEANT